MTTRRRVSKDPGAWHGLVKNIAPAGVVSEAKYNGPPPTLDAVMWLQKFGQALIVMGVATNRRVRVDNWERTGLVLLDLQYATDDRGRREYVSIPVPVEAARNHDTTYLLRLIKDHRGLTLAESQILTGKILQETDLKHVH